MLEKISALVLLTISPLVFSNVAVYASSTNHLTISRHFAPSDSPSANLIPFNHSAVDYLSPLLPIETLTRFSEEEIKVPIPLPFETEYVDDPESEIGTENILQEGINGQRTETYLVKYWYDEETERGLLEVQVTKPQKQIVSRGTKIIWRGLETSDYGSLQYWRKLRVWATSYNGNCLGCRGRTYSGTLVRHGTLAVDPSVIPLGTRVYIPGYGIGKAEDIGGGIKGKMIDLGFEDVSKGWWSARWTDIYLLD